MSTPLRALALKQPWASLVASGRKTIELRSWRTHYRGPLVIVASMKAERASVLDATGARDIERPHGVALALVTLVDVRPFASGDEAFALSTSDDPAKPGFSWILENVRALPVPYVPIKGKLGVFHVTYGPTIAALARSLAT